MRKSRDEGGKRPDLGGKVPLIGSVWCVTGSGVNSPGTLREFPNRRKRKETQSGGRRKKTHQYEKRGGICDTQVIHLAHTHMTKGELMFAQAKEVSLGPRKSKKNGRDFLAKERRLRCVSPTLVK